MPTTQLGDTIVALSTPYGTGAIAVVRLSGNRAFDIIRTVFSAKRGNFHSGKIQSRHLYFGEIMDGESALDEVLVAFFESPHSYTGEDMVEISCHGSPYIQRRLVELMIDRGARHAGPGEFSMRAFLNGKMDLSRTEAVADLIHSRSEAARKLAFNQLKGNISDELKKLREELIKFSSLIELELDFPEEDVEFADRHELKALIDSISGRIKELKATFKTGNALKNGIPVVIAGKPNTGKSTLLNALLRENRALVTDIPGTTRDAIEETVYWKGMEFRLTDTAGLRETDDKVERMGIERTREHLQKASVILYLFEHFNTTVSELREAIEELPAGIPVVLVANKSDISGTSPAFDIITQERPHTILIRISAKNEQRMHEKLFPAIAKLLKLDEIDTGSVIITNIRHYEALSQGESALSEVMTGLENGVSGDLLAIDIRRALYHLGAVTGEISSDDILGNIFSNFCIGK